MMPTNHGNVAVAVCMQCHMPTHPIYLSIPKCLSMIMIMIMTPIHTPTCRSPRLHRHRRRHQIWIHIGFHLTMMTISIHLLMLMPSHPGGISILPHLDTVANGIAHVHTAPPPRPSPSIFIFLHLLLATINVLMSPFPIIAIPVCGLSLSVWC